MEDSVNIDLYFDDESHFGLTPNVLYAWQKKENIILISAAKGKFLNVVVLMNHKNDLFFEVNETIYNSDKFILFVYKYTSQIVKGILVMLDNSLVHKSKKFITKIREWKEKDLLVFFLPPYSQELNLIEIL